MAMTLSRSRHLVRRVVVIFLVGLALNFIPPSIRRRSNPRRAAAHRALHRDCRAGCDLGRLAHDARAIVLLFAAYAVPMMLVPVPGAMASLPPGGSRRATTSARGSTVMSSARTSGPSRAPGTPKGS
jgi:hypothetical protein